MMVKRHQRGEEMLKTLFGSRTRTALLGTLFLNEGKEFYVRELERLTGEDYKGIVLELGRLERIGAVQGRKQGNLKYYGLNRDFLLYEEFKSIFQKTKGPIPLLRVILSKEKEIEAAFIFGSLAAGRERGDSDIDLMVIGNVQAERLLLLLREPEKALQREINLSVFEPAEVKERLKRKDPFITEVMKGPKEFLVGDEEQLRAIGKGRAHQAV
jgi:predicted nucleotidyltransferase